MHLQTGVRARVCGGGSRVEVVGGERYARVTHIWGVTGHVKMLYYKIIYLFDLGKGI